MNSNERLPPLPLPLPLPPPQHQQAQQHHHHHHHHNHHPAHSADALSPPPSSIATSSANSHAGGSQSSFTSAASSNGPKTPSPTLPVSGHLSSGPYHPIAGYDQYPAMNQTPHDNSMYYSQHMSAAQPPPPQTVTSGASMPHYATQPSLMQPSHHYSGSQYGGHPSHQYSGYHGLTSPPTAPPPSMSSQVLPLPGVPANPSSYQQQQGFDTTGQVAPTGMKPRVTATLWEDEGSLCFQVEARGICVASREDNHMINGTKLLNVAGMTRGRRDGILKSEKTRHVVKIGPMHLKGVWIPFERALDFANKEKITEMLYPLFVHNIGSLLYHPTNQPRTNQVMAAHERRQKQDAQQQQQQQQQQQLRTSQSPGGLPALGTSHHAMGLPGPQNSLPSHGLGRPTVERSQTFPTPPTSAGMHHMSGSDSFNWSQGQGMSGSQGANPMPIDTGLSNGRSLPTTPATTPPGSSIQGMQQYPQSTQPYDSSRQMYNPPSTQQSPYQSSSTTAGGDRSSIYNSSGYVKSEMGPPASRPSGSGPSSDQADLKAPNGILHSDQSGQPVAQSGEEEAEHEHDAEYTHNSEPYDAARGSYNYSAPGVGALTGEHSHLSPEMTGSPSHPPASGRATPRTAAAPQPYYQQTSGYNTPPRLPSASTNVYSVTNDRPATNGASSSDVYAQPTEMGSGLSNGYSSQAPIMNGNSTSMKRGREEDDDRPTSGGGMDFKRLKRIDSAASSYDPMNRSSQPAAVQPVARRR